MSDFLKDNDFKNLIDSILDEDTPAAEKEAVGHDIFGSGSSDDNKIVDFLSGGDTFTPEISTKIPTRKEIENRQKDEEKKKNSPVFDGKVHEFHNIKEENIFYKNTRENNESIIKVNREKTSDGEIKEELAIYNIEDNFISDIRSSVSERIPEVFREFTPFKSDPEKTKIIKNQIEVVIKSSNTIKVPPTQGNIDAIYDEIMGLGPLSILTSIPDVTEIMVVDYDIIYVEMEGLLKRVQNVKFKNREHLANTINRMVGLMGENINLDKPILDMRLSDGSRVNVVGPPITEHDHLYLLTIRRFRDTRFTLKDLLERDTISAEMMQYLSNIMKARANVLLCGGTGSGKTATLEALIGEKDPNECVVTVEDTRELLLKRTNWRAMKSKKSGSGIQESDVDIRKLVKTALRMRPDSIIVGETRDATAYDILFAMNSGHDGCATTVHANDTSQALSKFEMLAKLAKDEAPPTDALREIIIDCFDVVINIGRTPLGARKIMSIDEVVGYNEKDHSYEMNNVFRAVQTNLPDEKEEYKFIQNPNYYTTENLAFKLKRWGLPYVAPVDGDYRDRMDYSKVEKETERARVEAQKKMEKEKIRALRAAQKESNKIRRLQEREKRRIEAQAEKELAREKAKIRRKEERERHRLQRELEKASEKQNRQDAARKKREKQKQQKKIEREKNRKQIIQVHKMIDEKYHEVKSETIKKLLNDGVPLKEAKSLGVIAALEEKEKIERNLENLNPWQQRHLPKALEYQRLIIEENITPEELAVQKGVSVNNILKYLNIVAPSMVKAYREYQRKTKNDAPSDSSLDKSFPEDVPMVTLSTEENASEKTDYNTINLSLNISKEDLQTISEDLPVEEVTQEDNIQNDIHITMEQINAEKKKESDKQSEIKKKHTTASALVSGDTKKSKIKSKKDIHIELSRDDLEGVL